MKKFMVISKAGRESVNTITDAVTMAKFRAGAQDMKTPVAIWDIYREVVAAIVTDDANGLALHKLAWPQSAD